MQSVVESSNVVAELRGSDPVLRDQYVVFTAHIDHLGICPAINGDNVCHGALDNASGVATLLGVAEYFARIPASQRRRNIIFLGTSGHHNSGTNSAAWLAEHHEELFRKTALLINAEHTAAAQPEPVQAQFSRRGF